MQILDTLSAEYRRAITTVEMLDTLVVYLAQIRFELAFIIFVVFVEIEISLQAFLEIDGGKQRVVVHNFVEDVEVERQLVDRFDAFQNFAAHWAANSVVPKEVA